MPSGISWVQVYTSFILLFALFSSPHELVHVHLVKGQRGNGQNSTSITFTLLTGKNSIYRYFYIALPLGLTVQDKVTWPCLDVRGAGKASIFTWAYCCPESKQGVVSKKREGVDIGWATTVSAPAAMATLEFHVNGDPGGHFTTISCECETLFIMWITSSLQIYVPFLCCSCRKNSAIRFTPAWVKFS